MVRGEPRQEAGGGLADALAQAVRGRLELAFLHFARDRPRLGHGGFAVFMCKRLKSHTKAGPCPFHRNPQPNLRKKTGVILADYLLTHLDRFQSYDTIKIHYDNGQQVVTNAL